MRIKKIALSKLIVHTSLGRGRVQDISIMNQSNEHGRMMLALELDERIELQTVLRLNGTTVDVQLPDGRKLFVGICTDITFEEQNGYKIIRLEVHSYSYIMDVTPVSQTYQSPTKKLGDVVNELTARHGGSYRIAKDSAVPTVLYQQNETDWTFMKRLANQYQQEVYVDVQSQGVSVAIGAYSRKSYPTNIPMQQTGIHKDIGELRLVLGNEDPAAASYQYVTE